MVFLAFVVPILFLILFLVNNPFKGEAYPDVSFEWIPEYGINISFYIDDLSWNFGFVVTVITLAVFCYAVKYMKGKVDAVKFWIPISIFYIAIMLMLGSDDLLFLFVFWELTSVSSYFLISFHHEKASSRKAALTALFITGAGGLFMLIGITLLGVEANTFSYREIMANKDILAESPYIYTIMAMILLGAFTKSAQFPFHFWLPSAMDAPAPVSALLHSATMVKAGYFLLLKFAPLFAPLDYFGPILLTVGSFTMIFGAFMSTIKTDLKAILAYTTINGLGTLVMLVGIGTEKAIQASFLFFVVHAIYKSALFMVTGAVIKAAGTRDISMLESYNLKMKGLRITAVISCLSMAGIPLFIGFLAKEEIYAVLLNTTSFSAILVMIAVLSNAFLCSTALVIGYKLFKTSPVVDKVFQLRGKLYYIPALLISIVGLILGSFPTLTSLFLESTMNSFSSGDTEYLLHLWHGFSMPLILSVITVSLGSVIFRYHMRLRGLELPIDKRLPNFATVFHSGLYGLINHSKTFTSALQSGKQAFYLRVIITAVFIPPAIMSLSSYTDFSFTFDVDNLLEYLLVIIILIALVGIVVSKSVMNMAIYLGLLGLMTIIFFGLYGAPDLAMTQSLIEILSIMLFLTLISRYPTKAKQLKENKAYTIYDAVIAGIAGLGITFTLQSALNHKVFSTLAEKFAELSYLEAHGKNIVNVILVDFRGYDTFGEGMVIVIATLGIVLMFKSKNKNNAGRS